MVLYTGKAKTGRKCQYTGTRPKNKCVQVVTKWRDEAGAELLEAALVLPILLMLLLGIVVFGRGWNIYQTITRAAREGAREAVMSPCATCSGPNYDGNGVLTNFIQPAMEADGLDPKGIKNYQAIYVALDPNDPIPYICGIQISFDYPYAMWIPFTTLKYSTITLSTKVQMMLENQPSDCQSLVGTSF